jgi:hypothetical protein
MLPAVTRFAAAVGRRLLVWVTVVAIITVVRHLLAHH